MAILHPAVQRAIAESHDADERRADVMLATHGVLDDEQRARIAALAGNVRTTAGDVVTLDLPVRCLAALGELDFVRYVELARPLWLEKK